MLLRKGGGCEGNGMEGKCGPCDYYHVEASTSPSVKVKEKPVFCCIATPWGFPCKPHSAVPRQTGGVDYLSQTMMFYQWNYIAFGSDKMYQYV